jgi:16S rRNA G1207 methylase RsmC
MAKVTTGRAGREQKRAEILEAYGSTLARMLQSQVRPDAAARVLHIGSPGAAQFAEHLAPKLETGELVICVYTYDEVEDTRAALAGIGNVHVIDDLADLDEDEPLFDVVSCIAPFQLGRDTVIAQIEQGLALLAAGGTLYLAGDRQHEFDRYVEALSALARDVQQIAANGQYRVVSVPARNIRKSGRITRRRDS